MERLEQPRQLIQSKSLPVSLFLGIRFGCLTKDGGRGWRKVRVCNYHASQMRCFDEVDGGHKHLHIFHL